VGIARRTLAQVRSALGEHALAVAEAEKAVGIMRKVHGAWLSPRLASPRPCAPV
jgi:hypothetical protein